ncbi:MAG: inorganic phosphate transporter [Dehalococcoidales bacterium]|nr:inorganic phosphate transporter [Dehalococcoidales bacterium]
MPEISLLLGIVLFLVLAAEFVNGWTDSPNAIATVVSTRVMSPVSAVVMASALNIVGAIVTGTAVAVTIGTGIIKPDIINLNVVAAATLTVVVWSTLAALYGIPTSESHELIAGLTGAGLAAAGPAVLLWEGWQKVLLGLGFSTLLGFFFSTVIMTALYWLLKGISLSAINRAFSKLQILSAAFTSFSHGSNDGQKFMGVFTLALVLGGVMPEFRVPLWVMLLCGTVMGIGTATGGWRIIRTMGFRLTKLEPVGGFAAQTASGLSILLASSFGIPLSTTHCISSAIMGIGATRRLSAVRWGLARNIVITWLLTFPACGILGYAFVWALNAVFPG